MTSERRFTEAEVAEIFRAASSPTTPAPGAGTGLTLRELQAIGAEVGIAPERIAHSAHALDRAAVVVPAQRSLGMPYSVGRVLHLPRALTGREWELLVAEARATFRANGREASNGESRRWSNGNLHMVCEPTLDGYRLRLGTRKGDADGLNMVGISGVILGAASAIGMVLAGEPAAGYMGAVFLSGGGAASLAWNALRLPRWTRTREAQMDHLIERARLIAPE